MLVRGALGKNQIRVSGSSIKSTADLWRSALTQLRQPIERERQVEFGKETVISGGAEAKLTVPAVVDMGIHGDLTKGDTKAVAYTEKFADAGMDDAIQSLISGNKVLVIDDFHYVAPNIQEEVASNSKKPLNGD